MPVDTPPELPEPRRELSVTLHAFEPAAQPHADPKKGQIGYVHLVAIGVLAETNLPGESQHTTGFTAADLHMTELVPVLDVLERPAHIDDCREHAFGTDP